MVKEKTSSKKSPPEAGPVNARNIAKINLENPDIVNPAVVYFIHDSGLYGEAVEALLEERLYNPWLMNELSPDKMRKRIQESRARGQRYSGNFTFSESEEMRVKAAILQKSIFDLYVDDAAKFIGGTLNAGDRGQKSLDELRHGSDNEREYAEKLFTFYQMKLMRGAVIKVLKEDDDRIANNLEKILTSKPEQEEPKEEH